MMGRDALGAPRCMHIGMFLARSCAPLGAYRAREAQCRRDGADGAGDVPLSVALGRCRSLTLRGLITVPVLRENNPHGCRYGAQKKYPGFTRSTH